MTISALSSSTASTTTTSTTSTSTLGLDTSDFLQLMIEQLQNQDPTDPTDTSEFLGQLVDMANYDTQTEVSETLDDIVTAMDSMISSNGLGYIGMSVSAEGDTTSLQDGEASWSYTLDSDASEVTISVLDEDGETVYSTDGEVDEGSYDFDWDGITSDGTQMEDGGIYTIQVDATDSSGDSLDVSTSIQGTVTGVDSSTDDTYLMIGNVGLTLDSVDAILTNS